MTAAILITAVAVTAVYIALAPVSREADLIFALILILLTAALFLRDRYHRKRLTERVCDILTGKCEPTDEGEASSVLRLALELTRGCDTREARLREGYSRLASLVSDIAHQTKTPLAALKLECERTDIFTESAHDGKSTDSARTQLERLEFLIDALTRLSECESGLISESLRPTLNPLTELIAEALGSVLPTAEKKRIEFKIDCPERLCARFDLRWTAEAVANILDNAVKYSPEASTVTLTVTELESFVRLDAVDSGAGIPEDELSRIWERFYRGSASSGLPGVGIGLFLTREIITAQNGRVRAEVGDCGKFSVFLPKL